MKSVTRRVPRNASRSTKKKATAFATCDKDDRPAYSHRKKGNIVADDSKKRFPTH